MLIAEGLRELRLVEELLCECSKGERSAQSSSGASRPNPTSAGLFLPLHFGVIRLAEDVEAVRISPLLLKLLDVAGGSL